MLIPVLRDRTTKPPLGTPLRTDGHWSVQGLVGAWAFNEGAGTECFDAGITGKLSLITADVTRTPEGVAHASSAVSDSTISLGKPLNLGNSLSYIVDCKLTGRASGYSHVIGDGYNGNMQCGLKYWGGEFHIFTGGVATGASITDPMSLGRGVLALTVEGNNAAYYRSGIQLAVRTANTNSTSSNNFQISSDGYNRDTFGDYYSALVYNRPLQPHEVASISANPWQAFEPEIVWVEVGGTAPSSTDGYFLQPSISVQSVINSISVTGIQNGSVTVSNVASTPVVAASALSGIGNGIFNQPQPSTLPVISAPVVSAGQVGVFSQPATSTQPAINAATLTGIQHGSLIQPASTLQAAVLAATLTSGSIGSFTQPVASSQPAVSAATIIGQQQGSVTSPAVGLQPAVAAAQLVGSSVFNGTLAIPQSTLQAIVQAVSLQAFEPVSIVQAFMLRSTPVNIRFKSTPVNIQFRRVRP